MAQTPEDKAAAKAAKDAEKAAAKAAKTSVSVSFQGGTREFSQEIHGDAFEDVAAEFAETHKGTVE